MCFGEYAFYFVYAVVFQLEGDHAAEVAHLFFCGRMTRMIFKAGPINLGYFRMVALPMRDDGSILAMGFHSNAQGFDAAQDEKAVHRTGYGPTTFLNEV